VTQLREPDDARCERPDRPDVGPARHTTPHTTGDDGSLISGLHYIAFRLKDDPVKLKAAYAALEQRNQPLSEDIINPRPGESRMDVVRRAVAEWN
jgi:hypothetical protein